MEGVDAKVEPKTHEILLNQFSESRCRKLFPKRPPKQRSEAVRSIIDDLDRAKRLTVVSERTEALREVSRRMDELNIRNATEEKKAVRLDLHLRKGLDELLIDTTCTHPMTKAGRQPEIKRTWERILSDVKEVKDKPAAAVDAARAKKFQTYNPLLYEEAGARRTAAERTQVHARSANDLRREGSGGRAHSRMARDAIQSHP